nr:MAG TPA: hypothetical protein [Caudoviricetes sp.]
MSISNFMFSSFVKFNLNLIHTHILSFIIHIVNT